ncbi:MAG: methyltransferase domain-containing protein [Chloroflexi bacterium]|nr:methyltransferase domain-containing protein [Chloroflexota bacterium]
MGPAGSLPGEIADYYAGGQEAGRLHRGLGRLELARTQEIIRRHLPPPPAVVLDVGGGAGAYACWLAEAGYQVHLVDALPLHVEQARRASAVQPAHPLASARVGDARRLDQPADSADAVLLLGPLYHLIERDERLLALCEAKRILRLGGLVFAAGISRFASLLDGLLTNLFDDPAYGPIVERDLQDGRHRDPDRRGYFTTAFLHHPDELASEVRQAGFQIEETVAVEGPGWLLPDFDRWWSDPDRHARLLELVRAVEHEPSLLGVSAHVMVVARKGDQMLCPVEWETREDEGSR